MATTYPTTKQTFTDPAGTSTLNSPDHAGLHTDINDTVEAIQDTVGTTGGTNVLKDFAAGNFPIRRNASGAIQETVSGGTINNTTLGTPTIVGATLNNATFGTPAITGGTASNQALGTPTFVVGGDAQGDLHYRSSAGTLTKLSPGTVGQFLKTGGASANPSWSGFTAYQVNPTSAQTTANTNFEDMASGTQSVVLSAQSHVFIFAYANVANNSAGQYSYIQVAYDTGGADTVVGFENHSISNSANQEHGVATGGFALNLASGTYTFTMMKKVSGGTATIYSPTMNILVLPA